jgi:hypothetical protein
MKKTSKYKTKDLKPNKKSQGYSTKDLSHKVDGLAKRVAKLEKATPVPPAPPTPPDPGPIGSEEDAE